MLGQLNVFDLYLVTGAIVNVVGEPRPKFGKLPGRGAIKGLKADSYVKQPAGSESGLRL